MSKKELALKDAQLLALMGDDAAAGLEGVDKDCVAIPFLRVIQRSSPQVDETSSGFIESAKPGMLIESVTGKLFDGKTGVSILPCAFQRRYLRWLPDTGGFRGELLPEQVRTMVADGSAGHHEGALYMVGDDGLINPKRDEELVDTRMHFCLVESDGGWIRALLALSSTQIKKSKALMAMLSGVKVGGRTPPTWMNVVRLSTAAESNASHSWYGVKFVLEGVVSDPELYALGKDFHTSVAEGHAKPAESDLDGDEAF